MSNKFNIIGYHGTFAEDISEIEENGFKPLHRDNHWLGQGNYFYDNFNLAHWFVSRNKKTDPIKKDKSDNFAIIRVSINTPFEKVLNLDDPDGINYFYGKIHELWSELKPVKFDDKDDQKNRCFILDVLAETYGLELIIMTFERDHPPSYANANTVWFEKNLFPLNVKYKERQICVRKNECIEILEIEYPSKEYNFPDKIRFYI
jgi:hypothetical protein